MIKGQEVHVNWKHLVDAGCIVSFNRVVFDARHDLAAIYATVEHPTNAFAPIKFYATHHCGHEMTSRVDDTPQTLMFLAAMRVNFKLTELTR